MSITTANNDTSVTLACTAPSTGTLPEGGSGKVPTGTGINVSNLDTTHTTPLGIGADGLALRSGVAAQGAVYAYYAGNLMATESLSGAYYDLYGLPHAVYQGETIVGDSEIVVVTEAGGSSTATLTSPTKRNDVTFAALRIEVLDADGSPVPNDTVYVGSTKYTTDSAGVIDTESSGTSTVTALGGSLSVDVTLTTSSVTEVSTQYAGVKGSVKTMDGDPIGGKTVSLVDETGEVVMETETSPDGAYSIPQAPIDSQLYIVASPYLRDSDTAGEGEVTIKNIPAPLLYVGSPQDKSQVTANDLQSVQVRCIDPFEQTGATNVPVEIGDWSTSTSKRGIAGATLQSADYGTEATITVGGDDRYRKIESTIPLDAGAIVEVPLVRKLRTSQK